MSAEPLWLGVQRSAILIARLARAASTAILLTRGRKAKILATFGLQIPPGATVPPVPVLNNRGRDVVLVRNVRRVPELVEHPLVLSAPFTRSIVQFNAAVEGGMITAVIFDPSATITTRLATDIQDIVRIVADLVAADAYLQQHLEEFRPTSCEPAVTQFLLDTLVRSRSLRTRKDASFVTLRSWRRDIRDYQIRALRAIKKDPPPELLTAVSEEIVDAVGKLVGATAIDTVVPIPCGHSKNGTCFSVRIAQAVAERMNVTFLAAFENQQRSGSSHPRKSALLPPLRLKEKTTGSVLLLDDVASTGTHLRLGKAALERDAKQVVAIAWIG